MAVTKVSSAVHFLSRAAGVRGREGAVSGHWVPNTDVYVTDTGLVVKVELAGMKSDSLEITVEGELPPHQRQPAGWLPGAQMQFPGHGNQLRVV